jgi:hypothetical protein
MSHLDPFELDRQAKALRHQEMARTIEELWCAARKAWARIANRPRPACRPCGELAPR